MLEEISRIIEGHRRSPVPAEKRTKLHHIEGKPSPTEVRALAEKKGLRLQHIEAPFPALSATFASPHDAQLDGDRRLLLAHPHRRGELAQEPQVREVRPELA